MYNTNKYPKLINIYPMYINYYIINVSEILYQAKRKLLIHYDERFTHLVSNAKIMRSYKRNCNK